MRTGAVTALLGLTGAAAALSAPARAQQPATAPASTDTAATVAPPRSQFSYLQYGVALVAEAVASAGNICAQVDNCIFGAGGGLVARIGWRPADELYVGGAYEISKQDPAQLYRLGILQQIRAEGRRYFPTGREVAPFVLLGAGVSGYGNEWSIDTWGPAASLGGGIEVELGGPVLELSLAYRPMYFHSWVVSTTNDLQSGVAHFVGIEVSVEAKDRL